MIVIAYLCHGYPSKWFTMCVCPASYRIMLLQARRCARNVSLSISLLTTEGSRYVEAISLREDDGNLTVVCLMLRECRLLVAGGRGVTCRMHTAGRRARKDQLFVFGANRVLLVGGLGSLISCRRSPRRALLFYVLCCLPECTEGNLVQRLHRFSGVCAGCWGTGASKPPESHDRGTACERVWADAAGRRHFTFADGHAHTLDQ
jgi:prepilin-type processing-associated H-X9-DG protein